MASELPEQCERCGANPDKDTVILWNDDGVQLCDDCHFMEACANENGSELGMFDDGE